VSEADPESAARAATLVRQLSAAVHELYGVRETAEVVVADAVEQTTADAGALLVPDGVRWRVAAGAHLRSLEHRYEVDGDSWLVTEVVRAYRGAIIENTDVARTPLHGAPLASRRHLLAMPVPTVEGLLLVARDDDPPFTEDDLRLLARVADEAAPLLAAALDTRALARALLEFGDLPDFDDGPSH
jgi:GAF domain-containing protein